MELGDIRTQYEGFYDGVKRQLRRMGIPLFHSRAHGEGYPEDMSSDDDSVYGTISWAPQESDVEAFGSLEDSIFSTGFRGSANGKHSAAGEFKRFELARRGMYPSCGTVKERLSQHENLLW